MNKVLLFFTLSINSLALGSAQPKPQITPSITTRKASENCILWKTELIGLLGNENKALAALHTEYTTVGELLQSHNLEAILTNMSAETFSTWKENLKQTTTSIRYITSLKKSTHEMLAKAKAK